MRLARPHVSPTRNWSVFLKNHAKDVWARDFLPTIDLFFRAIYLVFIVEVASRRIVHFDVTSHPTDAWVAQQLREATPFGTAPRFLIRDRDSKYGDSFTRAAMGTPNENQARPHQSIERKILERPPSVAEEQRKSYRHACFERITS